MPGQHRLLRIKTQETEIDLTPHHMLWTSSRGMISANEVIIGDFINVHNHTLPATQSEVLSIEHLEGSVSAPVTMSGKIIVNGVEASCYAYGEHPRHTFERTWRLTPWFVCVASHEVVHQLVAPFRLLYKVSPSSLQALSWGILGLMDILSLAVSNTYTLELLVVSTTIILFLPIAAIQGALVAYRLRTDSGAIREYV